MTLLEGKGSLLPPLKKQQKLKLLFLIEQAAVRRI